MTNDRMEVVILPFFICEGEKRGRKGREVKGKGKGKKRRGGYDV